MDNIYYDLERILHGFTEDVLKELAKKLKRRIRLKKNNIIHEILSPPKGKREDVVKVWQEINRLLRKDLEALSTEEIMMFSFRDIPLNDQFKVGYMFTLSTSPEIREKGEKLYCQAKENKELNKKNEADALIAAIKAKEAIETTVSREAIETTESRKVNETTEARAVNETTEPREINETTEARAVNETTGAREINETIEARELNETVVGASRPKMHSHSEVQMAEDIKELHKRIRTLENKLSIANTEGLRTKEQFEKLKLEMGTLKFQWVREKEESARYRNLVAEFEEERTKKDKEIEVLKQRLEMGKTLVPRKAKVLPNRKEPHQVEETSCGEIDLAFYQGRKALIFAERDNEVDLRLNALGIIPIWAMEIDWNRPRRRMSTCEIVLYKKNNEKLQKLDEIRDIARYWNIPCNELFNI
ncbi:MAG TPA: hypothetical protein VIM51_11335 [Desulfosporosinus sp.]